MSIGVALFGVVFTVLFWLVRRRVSRLDALEDAVFGASGVRERLHKFVTLEVLDNKLNGIAEEGQRREDRILEAIANQTLVVSAEMREIKSDMRAQATRIDEAFRLSNQSQR